VPAGSGSATIGRFASEAGYALDCADARKTLIVAKSPSHHRLAKGTESGSVNEKKARPKVLVGILLLILTPVFLFVKPTTGWGIVRDLMLLIWWAFIAWLLVTGLKEPKPTDSK
jgi:hypothetical protein